MGVFAVCKVPMGFIAACLEAMFFLAGLGA
jgi:hypothetical protein